MLRSFVLAASVLFASVAFADDADRAADTVDDENQPVIIIIGVLE